MAFCTCTSNVIVPAAYAGSCDSFFRRARNNHFALIKCDWKDETGTLFDPTGAVPVGTDDLLDSNFWAGAVDFGVVQLSPPGNVVINTPDTTSFEIDGCGREVVGDLTYTVDFTTYQAGAVGFTTENTTFGTPVDIDYWVDFFNNANQYTVLFFLNGIRGTTESRCHHSVYMSPEAYQSVRAVADVAAPDNTVPVLANELQPGFEFSVSAPPTFIEGEENLGQWTVQFTIETSQPFGAVYADGLVQAIFGS